MSDQPFYAPNRTTPPRQPRAGEPLWTVEKDGRRLACELRDDGAAGVEVQMSRDGEFLYGRRCLTRALALEEADEQKARYLREGGVLLTFPRRVLLVDTVWGLFEIVIAAVAGAWLYSEA